MRLLLDTHVLIWSMDNERRLGPRVHALLTDPANIVLISIASLWEIAIKIRIGKLRGDLAAIDDAIDAQGFTRLPIALPHLEAMAALPDYHRDPFDHLLIAQAQVEGLTFVTADRHATRYKVETIACSA